MKIALGIAAESPQSRVNYTGGHTLNRCYTGEDLQRKARPRIFISGDKGAFIIVTGETPNKLKHKSDHGKSSKT